MLKKHDKLSLCVLFWSPATLTFNCVTIHDSCWIFSPLEPYRTFSSVFSHITVNPSKLYMMFYDRTETIVSGSSKKGPCYQNTSDGKQVHVHSCEHKHAHNSLRFVSYFIYLKIKAFQILYKTCDQIINYLGPLQCSAYISHFIMNNESTMEQLQCIDYIKPIRVLLLH